MKSIIKIAAVLLCGASLQAEDKISVPAKDLRAIGPLPEDKSHEMLQKGERNPFGERVVTKVVTEDNSDSEDAKLARMLKEAKINGIVNASNGQGVGIFFNGRLIREGDPLQPFLKNQTALLRVSKLTEKVVEISWVESQASDNPRKITREIRVGEPLVKQHFNVPGSDEAVEMRTTPNGEFLKEAPTTVGLEDPDMIMEKESINTKLNSSGLPNASAPRIRAQNK
jgi:hypothetical protein